MWGVIVKNFICKSRFICPHWHKIDLKYHRDHATDSLKVATAIIITLSK
jgi:hypothetical protein